ncbi:MAG: hypothetical protein H0W44_09195 [Gammaproteobacteria bacterium]|nr:hypothetical protein [Gammaproteobacteria bacterium]
MITYLYWIATFGAAVLTLFLLGSAKQWKFGVIGGLLILFGSSLAYYFHYQQVFVKQYGGVMSISVPEGQLHLSTTWKDDNLWVENYDPSTHTCYFNEYSKSNLLEGKVIIKNCHPVLPNTVIAQ